MYPDLQLVILEGRGANRFLRSWSLQFDHRRVLEVSDFRDHVACHRNQVFQWFLDSCRLPWLVLVDDDVVPVPETEELLRSPADFAGARAWGRMGAPLHPETFSMSAVKVHRRVIQAIAPPWFAFTFSPDGQRQEQCECLYFQRKVQAAGFQCVQAGTIGHRFPVTVLPGPPGADGLHFVFDGELTRRSKGGPAPGAWSGVQAAPGAPRFRVASTTARPAARKRAMVSSPPGRPARFSLM